MSFENPSVLEDFVRNQAEDPMTCKVVNGKPVYLSHNNFGPPESLRTILLEIADFGSAVHGEGGDLRRYSIQAPLYRAPEVLFGTGWSYSADIWNLGVLVGFFIYSARTIY